MFDQEFSVKSFNEGPKYEYKFNFEPTPLKDNGCIFECPFNSPLEFSVPEMVRSYENELTFDFDLSQSP